MTIEKASFRKFLRAHRVGRILALANELTSKWNGIQFSEIKTDNIENGYSFTAGIFLNGIDADKKRLYHMIFSGPPGTGIEIKQS